MAVKALRRAVDWIIVSAVSLIVLLRFWKAVRIHFRKHGVLPDVVLPRLYNDRVFWRKIFDHDPDYVVFNDKVLVRDWVHARAPEVPMVPMLWHSPDPYAVPDELLNDKVVFKANNGSGRIVFFGDGYTTREQLEERTGHWVTLKYGKKLGEWGYLDIPPQVLAEEKMTFADGQIPDNINIHCSKGEIMFIGVYRQMAEGARQLGFFDGDFKRQDLWLRMGPAMLDTDWSPSAAVKEAMAKAQLFSAEYDYLRCDFMANETEYWFNEITTYPGSGHARYSDFAKVDRLTARWDLRDSWFMRTPQTGWRAVYQAAFRRILDARQ